MFEHEGNTRTDRQNRVLAAYLTFVAGYVNTAGFVVVGLFTSHVTGTVGRLVDDSASGRWEAAILAFTLFAAFYAGAFVSSMAIEGKVFGRTRYTYASLLAGEAFVLGAFLLVSAAIAPEAPRVRDAEGAILCMAMGMQNSFVTRLSGAVVRTTHLTGIVTDLGIESARWFRFARAKLGEHTGVRLTVARPTPERPHAPKTALLATVLVAFVAGSVMGAALSLRFREVALVVPIGALLAGSIFAVRTGRVLVGAGARK